MRILIHLVVSIIAIYIAGRLIPGISLDTWQSLVILAIVLAVLNIFFKPIILLLTLPINILTLGIFSLVVNALLIMLAAMIVPGFHVTGFWSAFFFSIVVSLVTALFGIWERETATR